MEYTQISIPKARESVHSLGAAGTSAFQWVVAELHTLSKVDSTHAAFMQHSRLRFVWPARRLLGLVSVYQRVFVRDGAPLLRGPCRRSKLKPVNIDLLLVGFPLLLAAPADIRPLAFESNIYNGDALTHQ